MLLTVVGLGPAAIAGRAAAATTKTFPAKQPPYYRGEVPRAQSVAFLPVRIASPVAADPWEPRGSLAELAAELTERLASLHGLHPWKGSERPPDNGAPAVYVGCALDNPVIGDCAQEPREMVFAVTGPSKPWRQAVEQGWSESAGDLLLVPHLTISDHWLQQKSWRGSKEIPLGTGYSQPVAWLTSLDTPVQVLQLGAALVDPEGRVVRAGVEGLLAVRTPFRASVVGLQRILTDDEVTRLRTELRRHDLPGAPLVWEASLDTLVRQMLGR